MKSQSFSSGHGLTWILFLPWIKSNVRTGMLWILAAVDTCQCTMGCPSMTSSPKLFREYHSISLMMRYYLKKVNSFNFVYLQIPVVARMSRVHPNCRHSWMPAAEFGCYCDQWGSAFHVVSQKISQFRMDILEPQLRQRLPVLRRALHRHRRTTFP